MKNDIGRRGFLKLLGIGGASAAAVVAGAPIAKAFMSKDRFQKMLPPPSSGPSTSLSIPRDTPKDLHEVIMRLFKTTRIELSKSKKPKWFITLDYIQVTTPPDSKDFEVGIIFRYMPIGVYSPNIAKNIASRNVISDYSEGKSAIVLSYPGDTWRGAATTLMNPKNEDISLISKAFVSITKDATFESVYDEGFFDKIEITFQGNNLIKEIKP